jgi:sugar diacid utilization regulator
MRSNRNYFLNNKKQCLVDIAKEYDIHINTLRHRLDKLGLSIEEAITRPIDKRYSHGKRG